MARGRNRVRVTIEGEDQLSPAVGKAQKQVSGLTGGLKGLSGGLGSAAGAMLPLSLGAAGAGAAMSQAFGAAKTLNASMAEVASIAPELAADLGGTTDQVRDLSKETGIASDQIASGLYQAVSAGVPPDNVFDFLRTASQASIGGVTDLTTAVDGISSATNAWGADTLDAATAADQMFVAVRNGKCVVGSTRVLLADGHYERIDRLVDGGTVVAFDGRGFVPMQATWVAQGTKPTVRMTTRLGRTITTTWNHPYLTPDGWRKVKDLAVGDRIATPTHLPYFGTVQVPEHEAALLGLWLAEGASNLSSVKIATGSYGEQVQQWARAYGCRATNVERREGRTPTYQLVAGSRGGSGPGRKNPIQEMLRSHGLDGCTAGTKQIPNAVYTWNRASVATLLRWLFNGDGWLSDRRKFGRSGFEVGFCSKSEQLVRDVSHLLLRFGIVGRIRRRTNQNAWEWKVTRYFEVRRFTDLIGIDRPDAAAVAGHTPVKEKARWGVVEYDPIVAIEAEGDEAVYDLVVPVLHNFVAEDIVAHNTNFEELSRSIATVAPIASNTGVSFGEVTAALATLTASGTTTRESATQVRAAIQALVRPSTEMAAVFQAAGHASGEAAVKAVGFAGAAEIVANATGGSVGQMTQLLGSVEAVQAVLGVTGDKASVMAKNFDEATNATGAAGDAFRTVAESDAHQLDLALNDLGVAFESMAADALPAIADIAGAMSDLFDQMTDDERSWIEQSQQDGLLWWMGEVSERWPGRWLVDRMGEVGDAMFGVGEQSEKTAQQIHMAEESLSDTNKDYWMAVALRRLSSVQEVAADATVNVLSLANAMRSLDDELASVSRTANLAATFESYERNLMGRHAPGDAWGTNVRRRQQRTSPNEYQAPSYTSNYFGGDRLVPTEMLNTWETVYETVDKVDEATGGIAGNLEDTAANQAEIAMYLEPWQSAYDDVVAAEEQLNALKADELAATNAVADAQQRVSDITRDVSDQVNDILRTSQVYAASLGLARGGVNVQRHRQHVLGRARERFGLEGVDLYQENLDPEVAERARDAMAWVNEQMREYTSMTELANAEQQNILDLARAQADVVQASNQERLDMAGELVVAERDALTAVESQVEQAAMVTSEKQATLDLVNSAVELARIGEETTLENLQTRHEKLTEIEAKENEIYRIMTKPVTRTVNIIEKVTRVLTPGDRKAAQRDADANGRVSILSPDF